MSPPSRIPCVQTMVAMSETSLSSDELPYVCIVFPLGCASGLCQRRLAAALSTSCYAAATSHTLSCIAGHRLARFCSDEQSQGVIAQREQHLHTLRCTGLKASLPSPRDAICMHSRLWRHRAAVAVLAFALPCASRLISHLPAGERIYLRRWDGSFCKGIGNLRASGVRHSRQANPISRLAFRTCGCVAGTRPSDSIAAPSLGPKRSTTHIVYVVGGVHCRLMVYCSIDARRDEAMRTAIGIRGLSAI